MEQIIYQLAANYPLLPPPLSPKGADFLRYLDYTHIKHIPSIIGYEPIVSFKKLSFSKYATIIFFYLRCTCRF